MTCLCDGIFQILKGQGVSDGSGRMWLVRGAWRAGGLKTSMVFTQIFNVPIPIIVALMLWNFLNSFSGDLPFSEFVQTRFAIVWRNYTIIL